MANKKPVSRQEPEKGGILPDYVQIQTLDYVSSIEITSPSSRGGEHKIVLKMYSQPGKEQETADAAVKLFFRTRKKIRASLVANNPDTQSTGSGDSEE